MNVVLLNEIVLVFTLWDDMHYFGLNDYMMKVDDMNEVVLACYMDILIVC